MAFLKNYYKSTLCRQLFQCIYEKTNRYSTIRHSVFCLRSKEKQNISLLLSANKLLPLKTLEVSYASKLGQNVPPNLEALFNYEKVAEETLQSLYDRFEELLQDSDYKDWDVNYSNGVLTVTLKENLIYVINKQTPNRQVWLSSPVSGPKRYDYVNGVWVYKHDGIALHQLLTDEFKELLKKEANFFNCSYSS